MVWQLMFGNWLENTGFYAKYINFKRVYWKRMEFSTNLAVISRPGALSVNSWRGEMLSEANLSNRRHACVCAQWKPSTIKPSTEQPPVPFSPGFRGEIPDVWRVSRVKINFGPQPDITGD